MDGDRVGSWLPVVIEGSAEGHVHGLIWWEWNRPWTEKLLPAGVSLLGLGSGVPGEAKCEVCKLWGKPGGYGAAVHPPGPGPKHVGDRRRELVESGKKPEKAVETVSGPEISQESGNSGSWNDF